MRKICTLIMLILLSYLANAQNEQILNIQSFSAVTFANVNDSAGNVDSTSNEMDVFIWTNISNTSASRSYLRFDLSDLPSNAVVDSAYLSLYADPNATNGTAGTPTYGTNNAAGIYQVTSSWNTGNLSWSAQPSYSTMGAVTLPTSTSTTEDYSGIDVTNMVKNMVSENNYGFLIKMVQETIPSNSMIFYSPLATEAGKQPSLFVIYHMP